DADSNETIEINYTVNSGADSIDATVSVDVTAAEDPLVGAPTTVLADATEDTSFDVTLAQLTAGFTDADETPITVSDLTVTNATVIDNGDGTWTITPDADSNETIEINYTVNSGPDSIDATLLVDVTATEDPLVGAPTTVLADATEDTSFDVTLAQLTAGFTDADGTPITVSGLTASNASVVDNGDGTWTITPDANSTATIDIDYTVNSGPDSIAASLSVDVTAENDAPVTSVNGNQIEEDGTNNLSDVGFTVSDVEQNYNGGSLAVSADTGTFGTTAAISFDGTNFYRVGNAILADSTILGTATDEVIGTISDTWNGSGYSGAVITFNSNTVTSSVIEQLVDSITLNTANGSSDAVISITVTDADGASSTETVIFDNDGAATIDDFADASREIELSGASAVFLDDGSDATFESNGSATDGATLVISGVGASDTLQFNAGNGVQLLGLNLFANTTGDDGEGAGTGTPLLIGTVSALPSAGAGLTITFNSAATDAAISAVLQNLQVDVSAVLGDRSISIVYTSGDGTDTISSTQEISVVGDFDTITLEDLADATIGTPVVINGNTNINVATNETFDINNYMADGKIFVTGTNLIRLNVTASANLTGVVGLGSLGDVSLESVAGGQTATMRVSQAELFGDISVSGNIAITDLESDLAADLSDISAGTLTAVLANGASNLTFTGDFGDATVSVTGAGALSASAAILDGADVNQTGSGDIIVTGLSTGLAFDLSDIDASTGDVIIDFSSSTTLNAATNLAAGNALISVSPNVVLTLAVNQASGFTITGEDATGPGVTGGSIVITGVGTSMYSLTGITGGGNGGTGIAGTVTANIDATAATLGVVAIHSMTNFGSANIVVPDGITMEALIGQVNGLTVSGGSVALEMSGSSSADLSDITSTLTVEVTSSGTFSGDFGTADVTVNDGVILTTSAADVDGRDVTVGEDGGMMDVVGGNINVTDLEATLDADLSGIVGAGVNSNFKAYFSDNSDVTFTGDFGDFDVIVGEDSTLRVLATQIAGLMVSGENGDGDIADSDGGSIVAQLTTGTYDLSGVTAGTDGGGNGADGTFTGLVTGTLTLATNVNLGAMTSITLSDEDDDVDGNIVLTLTANQADGLTFSVDDNSGGTANGALDGSVVITSVTNAGGSLVLNGTNGNDTIGDGEGNDTINGGDGNDTITAAGGADTINGGAGMDTIAGGDGADRITGGLGVDTMDGGAGDDTFVFALTGDSGVGIGNRDIINNFTDFGVAGGDVLELAVTDNANAAFLGTGNFTVGGNGDGEVRYSVIGGNAIVEVDSNGNGVADYQIQLNGVTVLTASDFLFV
ncbi:beta strand repeat-containing protein, partial [Rhizobium sp.]